MTRTLQRQWRQWIAALLMATVIAPFYAMPYAHAQLPWQSKTTTPKKGLTTGQKVLIIGGVALLYYLWRKHQATVAARNAANGGVATTNGQMPQLYRSRNGGIYYRDPQGKPVWLTVPSQGLQVPVSDLRRYAPDYRQYSGPAPSTPQGYRTQDFSDFDPTVIGRGTVPTGQMR